MDVEVVEITAGETAPLRRSVLRTGTASHEVVWEGDDLPTTFHVGALVDGELVAVSSWMRRPFAGVPDELAYQIRGMATDPTYRRLGLGEQLLTTGLERCRTLGVGRVWARARDTALPFYEHRGFRVVGDGYVDPTTGLPHHDVVRELP